MQIHGLSLSTFRAVVFIQVAGASPRRSRSILILGIRPVIVTLNLMYRNQRWAKRAGLRVGLGVSSRFAHL